MRAGATVETKRGEVVAAAPIAKPVNPLLVATIHGWVAEAKIVYDSTRIKLALIRAASLPHLKLLHALYAAPKTLAPVLILR